jgi:hypothetical protein
MAMRTSRRQQRGWARARDLFGYQPTYAWGQQSQQSHSTVERPYGWMPNRQANALGNQFTNPLSAYFGVEPTFGDGPRGQRRQEAYTNQMASITDGDSPLAQYARQAGSYLPSVFGQANAAGQNVASRAPGLFELLQQQTQRGIDQLPGLEATAGRNTATAEQAREQAGQAVGQAGQAVDQAFSPIASQALYQHALQQLLEGTRGGAAARGLLGGGSTQASEEMQGRDLAAQYAQSQFGNQQAALGGQQNALAGQQNALGGVQNALGAQAGLLPMGGQLAGMQMGGLQGLQQALQAGYQMPMEALQAVFQQFAAMQNPQLALLGLTTPQIGQSSSGSGYNVL